MDGPERPEPRPGMRRHYAAVRDSAHVNPLPLGKRSEATYAVE